MSGFTDYHAHFVYGVDDGAQTREEMYAMLDAAAADGVRHLFATSHSTPGMERFPQEIYDRHLALARAYCTQKGYDLKLEHGSELLYTPATGYAAVQRQLLTLGDTGWVLLEFVPNITAKELEAALREITGAGYRSLVAHIERYPCLAQHGLLARLHEQYRLRCQINCSAVLDSGFWQRMRLEHWVKTGLVDAVSSDAHNCTSRPTRMRQAYERLCTRVGQTTAQKLTGWHRVSCIVALTAGNENGKDASFSQLLYEETDGEGTSFCKEVWSFWLFVQKNLRIKGQSVKLKQGTCMVNLRGCTNEDTGRR